MKINITKFRAPLDEKILHVKIAKFEVQIARRCRLTCCLCQHLKFELLLNFLIDLPRPVVNVQKVISFPTTFTWWYLTFVIMLKGIVSVLLDSMICYSCLYLISLSIMHMKAWMVQKNKSRNIAKAQTYTSTNQLEKIKIA
jgi:hypothetical protein